LIQTELQYIERTRGPRQYNTIGISEHAGPEFFLQKGPSPGVGMT